ncbi:hypothetical protein EOL70_14495 [Leucothrix sargassi]|nr:hypothetical protein EOL70_14495 [Leucothrix sargassi]
MVETQDNNDNTLVAEYILGLLSPEEAAAFELRMQDEPALRELYLEWSEYLAGLSDEIPEHVPPKHLKAAIQKRLFGTDSLSEKSEKSNWFGLRWAGSFAMLGLIVVLLTILKPAHFTPNYTAQLVSADQQLQVTALYDANQQSLRMVNFSGKPQAGRDFQLWAIVGDRAPVSLGVVKNFDDHFVTVPESLVNELTGATLAISDEALGGSTTGSPGPVLVAATIQAI